MNGTATVFNILFVPHLAQGEGNTRVMASQVRGKIPNMFIIFGVFWIYSLFKTDMYVTPNVGSKNNNIIIFV